MNPTRFRGLWLIVFVFSALVLQWNLPNLGGNHTPRSMFAWAALVLGALWCWLTAWNARHIYWRKPLTALFLPPIAVTLWGTIGPQGPFENYTFQAACALLFGALWVSALTQMAITRQQWLHLSNLLFVAAIALALSTMTGVDYFDLSVPLPIFLKLPKGGFQQPNNFASFLTTALLFKLWAYTRYVASAQTQGVFAHPAYRWFVWVGTFVIALMVWLLGSRTGYLGLLVATALLGAWVMTQHRAHKTMLMGTLAAIGLAFFAAMHADLLGVQERLWITTRLKDLPTGTATVVRQDMWLVSLSAWWQAPLLGHGLGSFTDVFTPAFDRLISAGYTIRYTENLSHPHNELLLWLCEMGLVGSAMVVGPWLVWVFHRKPSQTWTEQLGFWAVLAPIGLHCMTEFPLHGSGAHWFLLGLVLAANHESVEYKPLAIPRTAWLAGFSAITVAGALSFLFLLHTGYLSYLMLMHIEATVNQPAKYLNKLADAAEMRHPFLGQTARDHFLVNTVDLVFQSGNKTAIEVTCMQLKDLQRRVNNVAVKEQLKECP